MRKIIFSVLISTVVMLTCLVSEGRTQSDLISLDFQNVPLGTVLKVLSAKTDRKFITDTSLSGKKIVLSLNDVTPDEAVDALLSTYDLYYIRQTNTSIYVIKSKSESKVTTVSRIFEIKHAKSSELQNSLSTKLSASGTISADERTNRLIVTDMADNVDKVGEMIDELDIPTPQILLEARVMEVKITETLDMGIQLTDFYKVDKNGLPIGDKVDKDGKIIPRYEYNQSFNPGVSGPNVNVAIIEEGYNIDAMIEALQSKKDARLLNNPKILVLNNREAKINIGEEFAYQQKTQTEQGGNMVSTAFKEVGVKIVVKPRINNKGVIILEITPEQSFLTGRDVLGIPVIATSEVNTTFRIKDGETAVIGGLIREESSISENKVPILGDIPLIGYLFKKTNKSKSRSELTVFVTANIIKESFGD
ncbi:secretin N-terminal domain-containing protein [Elusimicrobiota bacterium]